MLLNNNNTYKPKVITIIKPDDWHLHLRDSDCMHSVIGHSAQHFSRAIIMPNLDPPITTVEMALDYNKRITDSLASHNSNGNNSIISFQPLMTLFLTQNTSVDEVFKAKQAGIVAFKLYPMGATTNSHNGVYDMRALVSVFEAMTANGILLLVHGEVVDSDVDIFDREAVFIKSKLVPLLKQVPNLKVVLEHITTSDAVDFVLSTSYNVAATITPQHMLLNRNAMLSGGIKPHTYCLPVLKREQHRLAILKAATSGNPKFFLGTDSAPHASHAKESSCGCAGIYNAPVALGVYVTLFEKENALDKLEAFTSLNGPRFYGLPPNKETLTMVKEPWTVPRSYPYGQNNMSVIPLCAGEKIDWQYAYTIKSPHQA